MKSPDPRPGPDRWAGADGVRGVPRERDARDVALPLSPPQFRSERQAPPLRLEELLRLFLVRLRTTAFRRLYELASEIQRRAATSFSV